MSLPVAEPARISQILMGAVSFFTDPQVITTSIEGTEAFFYSCLKGGARPFGRMYNWLRETSVERVNTVQTIFNAVSVGTICYYSKKLYDQIQFTPWTVGALFVGSGVAALGYRLVDWTGAKLAPEYDQQGVVVGEQRSTQQKIAKVLHVAKVSLNVALACFSGSRIGAFITLAPLGYSLWKNLQLKWITFTRPIEGDYLGDGIVDGKIKYPTLAFQEGSDQKCSVCEESDPDIKVALCCNHLFHKTCITQNVVNKFDRLVKRVNAMFRCNVTFYKNDLPDCPKCKQVPLQNHPEVLGTNWGESISTEINVGLGSFQAIFNYLGEVFDYSISHPQLVYETINAGYSAVQAGLAYLQTNPELAAGIFFIQKWMMIPDALALLASSYCIYESAAKKWGLEDSTEFRIAAVVATVALVALSYCLVIQLNFYLRSSLVLKDVIVASDLLKGANIDWGNPFSQQVLQTLTLARAVSSATLTLFSEQRKLNLFSATTQLASFVGISNLRWLEWTQVLENPLQEIAQQGAKFVNCATDTIKTMTVKAHFMVHSSCTNQVSLLQSNVKSIVETMRTLFEKSLWWRYWLNTYDHGVLVSSELSYEITLFKSPPYSILPRITDLSLKISEKFYQAVNIEILNY